MRIGVIGAGIRGKYLIANMSAELIWKRYVKYIGAGAVATAGLITLVRSIPVMVASFRLGAKQFRERMGIQGENVPRTQQDLPLRVVGLGEGLTVAGSEHLPVEARVRLTGSKLRLMMHQYFGRYVGEVRVNLTGLADTTFSSQAKGISKSCVLTDTSACCSFSTAIWGKKILTNQRS